MKYALRLQYIATEVSARLNYFHLFTCLIRYSRIAYLYVYEATGYISYT